MNSPLRHPLTDIIPSGEAAIATVKEAVIIEEPAAAPSKGVVGMVKEAVLGLIGSEYSERSYRPAVAKKLSDKADILLPAISGGAGRQALVELYETYVRLCQEINRDTGFLGAVVQFNWALPGRQTIAGTMVQLRKIHKVLAHYNERLPKLTDTNGKPQKNPLAFALSVEC